MQARGQPQTWQRRPPAPPAPPAQAEPFRQAQPLQATLAVPAVPAPAPTAPNPAIAQLEDQLAKGTGMFYEGVLDLNVPLPQLEAAWQALKALRGRVLALYGVPSEASGWGGFGPEAWWPGGGGRPGGLEASGGIDWKSRLTQTLNKKLRRSLTKGEVNYRVTNDDAGKGFVAAVSFPGWKVDEYVGEPASSKRQAEHEAARVALLSEYPEEVPPWASFGGTDGEGTPEEVAMLAQYFQGDSPRGQKRKGAPAAAALGNEDAKSRLSRAMQLLLDRPCLKGDINYDAKQVEGGFVATVALTEYGVYEGAIADNKKQAENNAAEAVLEALAAQIAPKEEERKEKKAKKIRENLEKLKASKALKKEEKSADATAIKSEP